MARERRQHWYTISFSSVYWAADASGYLIRRFCYRSRCALYRIICNRLGSLSKLIWELKFCVCLDAMKSQQDTEFTGCSGISALAYSSELLHLDMQNWKFLIMFLCSSSDNRDQCGCDIQYMVLEALCFFMRYVLPCSTSGRQWYTLVGVGGVLSTSESHLFIQLITFSPVHFVN